MSIKNPKDGTPIDEAIRRMESGPYSQSVCDGLRAAAEAFGDHDEPGHPWYTWPGRALLLVGSLAASVVRDWFPGRICSRCRWYKDLGRGRGSCNRELGYRHWTVTAAKGTCKHWEKL